jgi:hypothetical protein
MRAACQFLLLHREYYPWMTHAHGYYYLQIGLDSNAPLCYHNKALHPLPLTDGGKLVSCDG